MGFLGGQPPPQRGEIGRRRCGSVRRDSVSVHRRSVSAVTSRQVSRRVAIYRCGVRPCHNSHLVKKSRKPVALLSVGEYCSGSAHGCWAGFAGVHFPDGGVTYLEKAIFDGAFIRPRRCACTRSSGVRY